MFLRLPKLDILVQKNSKCDLDDPTQFIHVIKGHAVVTHKSLVIVDLRNYIKSKSDDENLEELDELMNWFEGKTFTADFWKLFNKTKEVSIVDESTIRIDDASYSNELYINHINIDTEKFKNSILASKDLYERPDKAINKIAFPALFGQEIVKAFPDEIKRDNLIMAFKGDEYPLVWTFRSADYIYGFIPTSHEASTEFTSFLNLGEFFLEAQFKLKD